jgi:hypothetical protein
MFKKLRSEGPGLVWTLSGTAFVLITLSGQTFKTAVWITGVAMCLYLFALLASPDDSE